MQYLVSLIALLRASAALGAEPADFRRVVVEGRGHAASFGIVATGHHPR